MPNDAEPDARIDLDADVEPETEYPDDLLALDRRRPAPTAGRGGSTSRLLAIATAVLLVAVVVLAAAVVRLKSDNDDLTAAGDQTADLVAVAGEFAAAVQSFDPQAPERALPTVERLSGDPFIGQYRSTIATLTELYTTLQSSLVPTVKEIYVASQDLERSQASVIVISDLRRTVGAETTTIPDIVIMLDLSRLDGGWKVTSMTNLNLALSNQGPAAGATTSVPGTSTTP